MFGSPLLADGTREVKTEAPGHADQKDPKECFDQKQHDGDSPLRADGHTDVSWTGNNRIDLTAETRTRKFCAVKRTTYIRPSVNAKDVGTWPWVLRASSYSLRLESCEPAHTHTHTHTHTHEEIQGTGVWV